MSAATETIPATRQSGRASRAGTAKKAKEQKAPRTSSAADDIRIGMEPRVDLLPTEIRTTRKQEQIVRRMVVGLVVTVAVVIVAVLGGNALALTAGVARTAEQAHGQQLLVEQQKYTSLRATQSELALVQAARAVGGSTDIDWSRLGTALINSLPPGAAITNVSIDSATPLTPYQQSLVPGAPVQVASAIVTISAPNLETVSTWLSTIGSMPDVVDTSAGAVTIQSGGAYQAIATIHYGVTAWDGTYLPKAEGK